MEAYLILCSNLDLKLKITLTLVVVVLVALIVFASLAFMISAGSDPEVLSQRAEVGASYGGWVISSEFLEIALAISAFAIVSGMLLSWHLTRRLHKLVALVKKIKEGELTARTDVCGDDEIAYLADNLNDLVRHLENEDIRSKDG